MANMCLFEAINGRYPNCNGACKKGKDRYCSFYYVDEIVKIMYEWKKEAHVETPILTKYDHKNKKFIIYTTKPGYMIGFHGKTYEKYKNLLLEKLRSHFTDHNGVPTGKDFIEFIECNDAIE